MPVTKLNMFAKVSTDTDITGELAHQSSPTKRAKIPSLLLQCTAKRWGHTPDIQVRWGLPPNLLPECELQISLPWQSS